MIRNPTGVSALGDFDKWSLQISDFNYVTEMTCATENSFRRSVFAGGDERQVDLMDR